MNSREAIRNGMLLLRLPSVRIGVGGEPSCRSVYESLVSRHPRYRLIQCKRWGVALLELPESFEAYCKGGERQALRTNRRKALSAGLEVRPFDPLDSLEDVREVNASQAIRQGRPVFDDYLSVDALRQHFSDTTRVRGAFTNEGRLIGYVDVRVCGDVFLMNRLLGHAEYLGSGVMYLLLSEVVREMIDVRDQEHHPNWGMYDTYFGASAGLRYFKERLGFTPYRVRWVWQGPR
jgi:hypothetical protein